MFNLATKPQAIIQVYKDSLQLYRQAFPKIWLWAFIIALAGAIPQIGMILSGQSLTNMVVSTDKLLAFTLILLVSAFFMTVIFYYLNNIATNQAIILKEAMKLAYAKLLTVIAAVIIVWTVSVIGLMLFIVPGIIIFVLLAFYMPLIVLDNLHVLEALRASATLVWKYWWQTFSVLAFPVLLLLLVMQLTMLLVGKDNLLAQTLINIVLITIFSPFLNTIIFIQFNNLKLLKKFSPK